MHVPLHSNSRAPQPTRRVVLLALALLASAGCSKAGNQGAATAANQNASADVAYTNGKIYTVNDAQPSAEAVADALEAAAEANGGKLKTPDYPNHMGFPTARDLGRITRLNGRVVYEDGNRE